MQNISSLAEPLEKLSLLLVKLETVVNKPKEVEVMKPKLQKAVAAVKQNVMKIIPELAQVQHLQELNQSLAKLSAKISEIEDKLEKREVTPRKDKAALEALLQPTTNVCNEVKQLKLKLKDVSTPPQQAVLSITEIADTLSELSSTIQQLQQSPTEEINDISTEQMQNISSLSQPLEKLSSLLVKVESAVNKPKELEVMKPELQKAVAAVKQTVMKITPELAQVQHLQELNQSLEKLSAKISEIEDKLEKKEVTPRKDKAALEALLQPTTNVCNEVKQLKLKLKDASTPPQQAVLSITEIADTLSELSSTIQKLQQIPTEEVNDISTEQMQNISSLSQPLEKLSSLLVKVESAVNKPKELEVMKPKLQKAVAAVKQNVIKITQELAQVQHLQELNQSLEKLSAKISEIEDKLEKREVTPRKDKAALEALLQPTTNVCNEVKQLKLKLKDVSTPPQQAVLSITEIADTLSELSSTIQQLQQSPTEEINDISTEQMQNISSLSQPLEKLSALLVKVESAVNKPKELEVMKPELQKAVAAVKQTVMKITPELAQVQHLQELNQSLEKLSAKISEIEDKLEKKEVTPRKDKAALEALLQPTTNVCNEVKQLKLKLKDVSTPPQQAVLSITEIADTLSELSSTIQKLQQIPTEEVNDISTEQMQNISSLSQPLEKLSSLLVKVESAVNKPKELEVMKPELQKAVAAVQQNVIKITPELAQVQHLQELNQSLEKLSSKISEIEEKLEKKEVTPRKDKAALEALLQPTINVCNEVKQLKLKLKDISTQPQQAVLSIIEIADTLSELSNTVQKLQQTPTEEANDISTEQMQNISSLAEPLEKLSLLLVKLETVVNKPKEVEVMKPVLQKAVTAVKQNVIKITPELAKVQHLQELNQTLEKLSAKISEIEEKLENKEITPRKDVLVIKSLSKNLKKLNDEVTQLHGKTKDLPQQGVLGVLEIAESVTKLNISLQSLQEPTDGIEDITTKQVKIVSSINEPLAKLSNILISLQHTSTKPETFENAKPELKAALSAIKDNLENIAKVVSTSGYLNELQVPFNKLSTDVVQVLENLEKQEMLKKERKDLKALKAIIEPFKKLDMEINKINTQSVTPGVSHLVELAQPLTALSTTLQEMEKGPGEGTKDITSKQSESISKLAEPISTLTLVIFGIDSSAKQAETFELTKRELKTALAAVKCEIEKVNKEISKSQYLKQLSVPLNELTATIGKIEERLEKVKKEKEPRKDLLALKAIIEPVQGLSTEVKKLKVQDASPSEVSALVELVQPLVALSSTLQEIEKGPTGDTEDISSPQSENISKLATPICKLTSVIAAISSSAKQAEIIELTKPELKTALQAVKCEIKNVNKEVAKSQYLKQLSMPLNTLTAVIEQVEQSLEKPKRDLSALKTLVDLVVNLSKDIKELKVKDTKRRGVMSIVEISEPLSVFSVSLQELEKTPPEEITTADAENISTLGEPLTKLSAVMINIKNSVKETQKLEAIKPELRKSLEAVKVKLSIVVSKTKPLEKSAKALISSISHVEEQLDVPDITPALDSINKLSNELAQLEIVSKNVPLSTKGIVSILQLPKDISVLSNDVQQNKIKDVTSLVASIDECTSVIVKLNTSIKTKPDDLDDIREDVQGSLKFVTRKLKGTKDENLNAIIVRLQTIDDDLTQETKLSNKVRTIKQNLSLSIQTMEQLSSLSTEENLSLRHACSLNKPLNKVMPSLNLTTVNENMLTDLKNFQGSLASLTRTVDESIGAAVTDVTEKDLNNHLEALKDSVVKCQASASNERLQEEFSALLKEVELVEKKIQESKSRGESNLFIKQLKVCVGQLCEEMKILKEISRPLTDMQESILTLRNPLANLHAGIDIVKTKVDKISDNTILKLQDLVPTLECLLVECVKLNSVSEQQAETVQRELMKILSRLKDQIEGIEFVPIERETMNDILDPLKVLCNKIAKMQKALKEKSEEDRQKALHELLEPLTCLEKEVKSLKKDLEILSSAPNVCITSLTDFETPLKESIKQLRELELGELKASLQQLKEPLDNLAKCVGIMKSVATSEELTLLELPTLTKAAKATTPVINELVSNPKLKQVTGLQAFKSTLDNLLDQCNKQRNDHKSLTTLKVSLEGFKSVIQNISSKKKAIDESISLICDLKSSTKQLETNTTLALDFGDNFNDFTIEYSSRLTNIGDEIAGLTIFLEDIASDPSSLDSIQNVEEVLCATLTSLIESIAALTGAVVLNEKMEIVSQSISLFSEDLGKVLRKLKAKALEKRRDLKFIDKLLPEMQNFMGSRKVLKKLSDPIKALAANLPEVRRNITETKPADFTQITYDQLALPENLSKGSKNIDSLTTSYENNRNSIIKELTCLKDNTATTIKLLDSYSSFSSTVLPLQDLLKALTEQITDIQSEIDEEEELKRKEEELKQKEEAKAKKEKEKQAEEQAKKKKEASPEAKPKDARKKSKEEDEKKKDKELKKEIDDKKEASPKEPTVNDEDSKIKSTEGDKEDVKEKKEKSPEQMDVKEEKVVRRKSQEEKKDDLKKNKEEANVKEPSPKKDSIARKKSKDDDKQKVTEQKEDIENKVNIVDQVGDESEVKKETEVRRKSKDEKEIKEPIVTTDKIEKKEDIKQAETAPEGSKVKKEKDSRRKSKEEDKKTTLEPEEEKNKVKVDKKKEKSPEIKKSKKEDKDSKKADDVKADIVEEKKEDQEEKIKTPEADEEKKQKPEEIIFEKTEEEEPKQTKIKVEEKEKVDKLQKPETKEVKKESKEAKDSKSPEKITKKDSKEILKEEEPKKTSEVEKAEKKETKDKKSPEKTLEELKTAKKEAKDKKSPEKITKDSKEKKEKESVEKSKETEETKKILEAEKDQKKDVKEEVTSETEKKADKDTKSSEKISKKDKTSPEKTPEVEEVKIGEKVVKDKTSPEKVTKKDKAEKLKEDASVEKPKEESRKSPEVEEVKAKEPKDKKPPEEKEVKTKKKDAKDKRQSPEKITKKDSKAKPEEDKIVEKLEKDEGPKETPEAKEVKAKDIEDEKSPEKTPEAEEVKTEEKEPEDEKLPEKVTKKEKSKDDISVEKPQEESKKSPEAEKGKTKELEDKKAPGVEEIKPKKKDAKDKKSPEKITRKDSKAKPEVVEKPKEEEPKESPEAQVVKTKAIKDKKSPEKTLEAEEIKTEKKPKEEKSPEKITKKDKKEKLKDDTSVEESKKSSEAEKDKTKKPEDEKSPEKEDVKTEKKKVKDKKSSTKIGSKEESKEDTIVEKPKEEETTKQAEKAKTKETSDKKSPEVEEETKTEKIIKRDSTEKLKEDQVIGRPKEEELKAPQTEEVKTKDTKDKKSPEKTVKKKREDVKLKERGSEEVTKDSKPTTEAKEREKLENGLEVLDRKALESKTKEPEHAEPDKKEKETVEEPKTKPRKEIQVKPQTKVEDETFRPPVTSSKPPAEDKKRPEPDTYVSHIDLGPSIDRTHLQNTLSESRSLRTDYSDLDVYRPTSYHGPRVASRKPIFTTSLTDRYANVGSRIKLTCSFIEDEEMEVVWLKNGEVISEGSNYCMEFGNNVATLEILNTGLRDSGEYSCVARNAHGFSTTAACLRVAEGGDFSSVPATFTRGLKDKYDKSKDELTLECKIRYAPSPRVRWFRNGEEIGVGLRHSQSYSADGICRLTIKTPDAGDSGRYICRVEDEKWNDQVSHDVTFVATDSTPRRGLQRKDTKSRRSPYFGSVLTDALVPTGGVMALQVEVKGSPAEVNWFKESRQLPRASSRHRTFAERGVHTLVVPDIGEYEAGKYTCRAINSHGRSETSAYVQVVPRDGKPAMFLHRPDKLLNIAHGEDVVVSCRVTGTPKPTVIWMKGLKDITCSMRSLKETSDDYIRFTLKRATEEDVGTYCILAKNRYGCDRAFFTVRLRPRARSVTPTRTVPELVPYSDRCHSRDVPGPIPGAPVVVDTGRNWLSLSWGRPEHRGAAPVVAYKVEAWQKGGEGGARWTELGVSGHNSFDAFNLKPGGQYQFRVTPRNRYGWGESVQSGVITVGKLNALPEFTRILPGQLKSLLGSDVSLECEVRGDPAPAIKWFRDSSEIFEEDDERFTMLQREGICSLTIRDVLETDSGRFMCEATNRIGRVSTFVRLSVVRDPKILSAYEKLRTGILDFEKTSELPPQFTMRLRDRRVQVTYPVRLTCQVAGCPEPTIRWFKGKDEIKVDSRHSFWTDGAFHTLELGEAHLEDSGVYTATASNSFGSISCRCSLVIDKGIRAYISPQFSENLAPALLEVQEGRELRLAARVQAYPVVGIMWYRDGVRLRPSRRATMTLSYDGRVELSLGNVSGRDAGVYTCVASNEIGRAETSARINVLDKSGKAEGRIVTTEEDIPYSKEPKFLKKPLSTEAFEGDTVIILCEVIGDPKPEVVWLRDFLKPDYYRDAAHFHRIGDGPEYRLEIPNAKLDYTGTYTVYAKNSNGDAKAIISLQIKVRDPAIAVGAMDKKKIGNVKAIPKVAADLRDIRCCDGDSVTLECRFEAATVEPDIRWEKNGKLLSLGGDFSTTFDGETAQLVINQVYPEDEGEYSCVAYNELGKAVTSACLLVDIPEEKDNLLKAQLIRPPGSQDDAPERRVATPLRSVSPRPPRRREEPTPTERRALGRMHAVAPKFYAYPHNKVAEEGETVRFQCAVAGHPDPWVTWEKDGKVVTPTAKIRMTERDDLRTLEISDVTPCDSGMYKVVLENDVGRVEATARLDVIRHRIVSTRGLRARSLSPRAAPIYSRNLFGGTARLGTRARLYCEIDGIPMPGLRWFKDGIPLDDQDKYKFSYNPPIASLEVDKVTEKDEGVYSCVATNKHGTTETSARLQILEDEIRPPEITKGLPKHLNVTEGGAVKLELKAVGTKPFDVVWMKDGCILPDCEDFRQTNDSEGKIRLQLPDAYSQDSGDYRCEIYNMFGDAFSTCRLDVKEKVIPRTRIEFLKYPNPVMVTEGATASFCVRVRSNVEKNPDIEWEVAGQKVRPSPKYKVETDGDVSILHVFDVTSSDVGPVRCVASLTEEEKGVEVASAGPAEGTGGAGGGSTSACCGTELTVIERRATLRDRRERDDGAAASSRTDSTEGDRDTVSEEQMDGDEEPAMLLRAPQNTTALVGDRVLLKATYLGRPEPEVRWTRAGHELKNDERTSISSGEGVSCLLLQNITTDDSGKYDVHIENVHGADYGYASVSVEGPPDPPSGNPCITADVDNVHVAWSSSPYDGGRIVTGYAVEHSLVGSDIWTTDVDEWHSLSYTVRGLQPGGKYVFRVRAQNVHGYSKPSLESDIVQLEEHNESSSFEPRIVLVEPGPEFKSRYDVLEELGKGRFGVVHKVIDKETSQKLAAKFIKCRTSKDRDKVQDEIDIMNLLRHQKLLQLAAAFENPREMIMVMEYISGGELFERVVADDFTLTEKDCILFMRQICEGVAYMHSQDIVHLDLKPENIMCHTRTSHEIKIIDFGLAQKLDPEKPIRVLFGTPEFIPPEIIGYEPIGVESDMWSLGVICYVLLSGLSPFMGDSDSETFANITRADYDFEDDAFNTVSQNARDFIGALLIKRKEDRLSAEQCLKHVWLDPETHQETVVLCTDKLKKFIIRRKWQKTGNAIRALGRMATLSASRRNSANSNPNTPRTSISGSSLPRMSSLNEEKVKPITVEEPQETTPLKPEHEEPDNRVKARAFSERSDSGISDCSSHLTSSSCTSTPLLGKKFCIDEESESDDKGALILVGMSDLRVEERRQVTPIKVVKEKPPLNVKLVDKIETFNNGKAAKSKPPSSTSSVRRIPIYSSRTVAGTVRKFDSPPNNNINNLNNNSIKNTKTTTDPNNAQIPDARSPTAPSDARCPKISDTRSPTALSDAKCPKTSDTRSPSADTRSPKISDTRSPITLLDSKSPPVTRGPSTPKISDTSSRSSRVDKVVDRLSNGDGDHERKSVRYRSPSPSLLRKTQSVIAKENCNSSKFPRSPIATKRISPKPKSESFQKAAAFWNLS